MVPVEETLLMTSQARKAWVIVLFSQVTGHSLYNLLSISEVQVDPKTDKPVDPVPRIKSTEVLYSPFGNLQPRADSKTLQEKQDGQPHKKQRDGTIRHPAATREALLIKYVKTGAIRLLRQGKRKIVSSISL